MASTRWPGLARCWRRCGARRARLPAWGSVHMPSCARGGGDFGAAVLSLCADLRRCATLQTKRLEHEGDWAGALVSYDLVLQNINRQQYPQGGTSPAAGGAGRARKGAASCEGVSEADASAGMLRSLQRMGATHLLALCGQLAHAGGVAPGGATPAGGHGGRSDDRDGAVWQSAAALARWGELGAAPAGGEPLGHVLEGALSGLASANADRCRRALRGARQGLVARLSTAGMESAAAANPMLAALQMLQVCVRQGARMPG